MANASQLYRLAKRGLRLDITHLLYTRKRIAYVPDELECRWLSPLDVHRLGQHGNHQLEIDMARRLESGLDYCAAAFLLGTLAGYCWLALDSIESAHNRGDHPQTGVAISFTASTAFVYKAFTVPSFRGKKVFHRLLGFASRQLHSRGVEAFVSTTDWQNHSAIRAFGRCGFRSLGRIYRIGLTPGITFAPACARSYGIRIGRQAKVALRT